MPRLPENPQDIKPGTYYPRDCRLCDDCLAVLENSQPGDWLVCFHEDVYTLGQSYTEPWGKIGVTWEIIPADVGEAIINRVVQ